MDLRDRSKWVAIIGSRKASDKELQTAYAFGKKCAEKGMIVVSGLAEGVDTYAHMGALAGGGKTIAVVSTSPDEPIYPKQNQSLAERIERQGCILHPFGTKADWSRVGKSGRKQPQDRLIERDVLVAYLCPIIFTVKDGDKPITGGTKWAMNYGKVYGQSLYRIGSDGKITENPAVQRASLYWDMELDLATIQHIVNA